MQQEVINPLRKSTIKFNLLSTLGSLLLVMAVYILSPNGIGTVPMSVVIILILSYPALLWLIFILEHSFTVRENDILVELWISSMFRLHWIQVFPKQKLTFRNFPLLSEYSLPFTWIVLKKENGKPAIFSLYVRSFRELTRDKLNNQNVIYKDVSEKETWFFRLTSLPFLLLCVLFIIFLCIAFFAFIKSFAL